MGAVDWGSAPEWLAAVGTLAAVGVSVGVAIREVRLRKIAETELAEHRARSVRADAEAFVAWMEVRPSANDNGPPQVLMHLQNTGPRPIYDVLAQPVSIYTRHSGQKIASSVVGPNSDLIEDITRDLHGLVGLNAIEPKALLDPQGAFGIRTTYRDSSGYGWERSVAGLVFQIPRESVEVSFWRKEDRDDFSHVPWSRPPGWAPTVPDPSANNV